MCVRVVECMCVWACLEMCEKAYGSGFKSLCGVGVRLLVRRNERGLVGS